LRATLGGRASIDEAVAALQTVSCVLALSSTDVAGRVETLRTLDPRSGGGIRPQAAGPYILTSTETLTDWLGQTLLVPPTVALCRCGGSTVKPFCDGSHRQIGFDDAKDPKRVPDRRDTYAGQLVTILDNRGTCAHSGFCTDRLATVFHVGEDP